MRAAPQAWEWSRPGAYSLRIGQICRDCWMGEEEQGGMNTGGDAMTDTQKRIEALEAAIAEQKDRLHKQIEKLAHEMRKHGCSADGAIRRLAEFGQQLRSVKRLRRHG